MFEVKFGYISGLSLVFSAFQSSGAGRGIEHQPLPESNRPKGYYSATPITELVIGDEVLVYVLENVLWEDEPISILTEDFIYYEGDMVHWEGELIISTDDFISCNVTWVGDPIGAGEYSSEIDISDFLNQLITGQNKVLNVYLAEQSKEQMRGHLMKLNDQDIGYFKRKRLERESLELLSGKVNA